MLVVLKGPVGGWKLILSHVGQKTQHKARSSPQCHPKDASHALESANNEIMFKEFPCGYRQKKDTANILYPCPLLLSVACWWLFQTGHSPCPVIVLCLTALTALHAWPHTDSSLSLKKLLQITKQPSEE